jgi:chloramphenicol-sensitive protein RarD
LAFTGVLTAGPLLLFGAAVRCLKLSTIGFLQYVGPTLQFLVAILVFREPLSSAKLLSFALIWLAIAVYVTDSLLTHTAQPLADRPE